MVLPPYKSSSAQMTGLGFLVHPFCGATDMHIARKHPPSTTPRAPHAPPVPYSNESFYNLA